MVQNRAGPAGGAARTALRGAAELGYISGAMSHIRRMYVERGRVTPTEPVVAEFW